MTGGGGGGGSCGIILFVVIYMCMRMRELDTFDYWTVITSTTWYLSQPPTQSRTQTQM